MVQRGRTHSDIAINLQQLHPHVRGLSERSVRRYCRNNSITRITDTQLDHIVSDSVARYGHGHCRSMMQGSVRATRCNILSGFAETHCKFIETYFPFEYEQRTQDLLLERTNPVTLLRSIFWV